MVLAASLGAAAASVWLDRNADRARQGEQARRCAELAARLSAAGGGRGGACLDALLPALLGTETGLRHVSVETGDGAVLARAGDPQQGTVRLDRTLPSGGGPVRVRIGCEEVSRPLAWGIRAAFWAVLVAVLQGLAAVLPGRRP